MATQSPLKAKPLRNPGQSLDEEIDRVVNDKFLAYFLAAVTLWVVGLLEWLAKIRNAPRSPAIYVGVAIVATVIATIQFYRVRRRIANLRQGRDGERAVGQFLERLREDGGQIFHDIPGRGFNLDHVVISAKGILVIETKTWSKDLGKQSRISASAGALYKNGYRVEPNPINQVVAGTRWLKELLLESTGKSLPVFGAVLFPGWFVEPIDAATRELAWILEPKALPSFVENEPTRLAESDIRLAAFHLSRYIRTSPPET
jgi:hypothetical protein